MTLIPANGTTGSARAPAASSSPRQRRSRRRARAFPARLFSHAIERVFADGDYVMLDVHMIRFPGERGLAIGETFRLEDGKIVERWDRIQAIPDTAKNTNTMF